MHPAGARLKTLGLSSTLALALTGCGGVLEPRGPVGAAEKLILLDSLAIMLAIVVPLIVATFAFAWWFRSSNKRARYRPEWSFSGALELMVWAVPAIVITFLGGIAWFGSHALDPYRALPTHGAQLEIEVVSLDWKWLFIYPGQHVATLNQLVIPVGTPVHFRLTSTGVMNSFFVPQLGSQIYTMAGMTSQVSLQADTAGDFEGLSAQFSGRGFADMRFKVHAIGAAEFATWLAAAHDSGPALTAAAFAELSRPSVDVAPATYRDVAPEIFPALIDPMSGAH